jgi:hypothetical protein
MYLSGDWAASKKTRRRTQPVKRRPGIVVGSRFLTDSQLGIVPVVPILKGAASIAQVVGLTKKPPTRQKQTFAAFKKTSGPMQGREIDINTILDGLYYPFKMTDHGIFRVRKQYKELGAFVQAFAKQIADAALSGRITDADDANAVYNKVIAPWFWPIAGKVTADVQNTVPRLLTALADHYLYDLPMMGTVAKYGSQTIPKLSDIIRSAGPASLPVAAPSASVAPILIAPEAAPAAQVAPATAAQAVSAAPQMISIPGVSTEAEAAPVPEVTRASFFTGTVPWLIPTILGAVLIFSTRRKRRR